MLWSKGDEDEMKYCEEGEGMEWTESGYKSGDLIRRRLFDLTVLRYFGAYIKYLSTDYHDTSNGSLQGQIHLYCLDGFLQMEFSTVVSL